MNRCLKINQSTKLKLKMKTKLLVLAILLFPLMLSAQDIPLNIKQKVKSMYPAAKDIKWDVEGKGKYACRGYVKRAGRVCACGGCESHCVQP